MSEEEKHAEDDPVGERIAGLITRLDRLQEELGLPAFPGTNSEATSLLDVSGTRLRGMTALECEEGAFLLQQFALHLQRRLNRLEACHGFAEDSVRTIVAEAIPKTPGWNPEERRSLAVSRSPTALRFEAFRVDVRCLATDLAYLAVRVENQARRLSDLAKLKASKEKT